MRDKQEIIKDCALDWFNRNVELMPSCLFPACAEEGANNFLELVDSNRRVCSECEEEVEKGRKTIECPHDTEQECGSACRLLDVAKGDEGMHTWACESCNANDNTHMQAYEELPLGEPRYGSYPAAHGYVYWIHDGYIAGKAREHAASCNFLVYEPATFEGIILAIDGGGYDLFGEHWVPLYLAIGCRWHTQDRDWEEACKREDVQRRHRLNSQAPVCPRVSGERCYNPNGIGDCQFLGQATRGTCKFNHKDTQ